jgi:tripartite-type tricarboxylate transporter receptor subunit TctC
MHTRRRVGTGALLVAASAAMPRAAPQAQSAWPGERPVEVIVPYPPGGGVDITTRLVLRFAPNHLPGARFVVVNRPGAGGQLGFEAAFNAAADGWTLCAVTAPAMLAMPIERTVRYRPLDWTFFANVVDDPNAFYVAADSRLRSLADLVATAKARPGGLSYGSTGVGGDDHIAMLAFEGLSGMPPLVHAPFAGNAPATQALLGGHLALLVGNIGENLALLREGRVRCLGVAAPERLPQAAEQPTFREQGIDLVTGASRGLIGPPGMPAPIRARLQAAFAATVADPDFVAEAGRLGMPLRPLIGEDYGRMLARMEASLRELWQRRPWREG